MFHGNHYQKMNHRKKAKANRYAKNEITFRNAHGGAEHYPNFRSWPLLIQLSTLESVGAIERSPPQTARLPDRVHLHFAAIFLPGEAR